MHLAQGKQKWPLFAQPSEASASLSRPDTVASMANDNASSLYCQKCRTPIDIHVSIDQLNPAAFKLLTGKMMQIDIPLLGCMSAHF